MVGRFTNIFLLRLQVEFCSMENTESNLNAKELLHIKSIKRAVCM